MKRGTQMKPEQRVPISLSGIWSTAYNAVYADRRYCGRLLRRQRRRERSSGGSGSAAPGTGLDPSRPRARRRQSAGLVAAPWPPLFPFHAQTQTLRGTRYHQLWSTWVHDLGRRRGTYDRALSVFGTIRELTLNRIFER